MQMCRLATAHEILIPGLNSLCLQSRCDNYLSVALSLAVGLYNCPGLHIELD